MTSRALRRSFDVYYRDAARTTRMDALNAQFIRPGGLAFDIGAHVGDRTASFRRLGARVVAVEPQPKPFRALRLLFHNDPHVTLVNTAVGATTGEADMRINATNPTVSTLSNAFVEAAPAAEAWQDQAWHDTERVQVTTLDALIVQHGCPDFIKIDVEGFEAEVLAGLSHEVPALSFEFTTLQRDVANACLDRLTQLGPYRFNLSFSEDHSLFVPDWISADQMRSRIMALPDAANSGDVFAVLTSG